MLASVFGFKVALGLPATVTSPDFAGCVKCRWEPDVRFSPSEAGTPADSFSGKPRPLKCALRRKACDAGLGFSPVHLRMQEQVARQLPGCLGAVAGRFHVVRAGVAWPGGID